MKRPIALLASLLAVTVLATAATAAGGNSSDPLISLNYLQTTFTTKATSSIDAALDKADQAAYAKAEAALRSTIAAAEANVGAQRADVFTESRLKQGDILSGTTGLQVIVLAGSVNVQFSSGAVVDVTTGSEVKSGAALAENHRYLVAEDTTALFTVTGKTAVIAGYGWCGKGCAMRAKGLGAHVIVTEVDPIKAIEAVMDGFEVMPMAEAAKHGDIFLTVTGDIDIITEPHFLAMKDGAICANAGHFDCEVSRKDLERIAVSHYEARKNIEGYVLPNGKTVFLMAEGRLVNLAAGDGHPAEIMDLSFAMQTLAARYLLQHGKDMKPAVYTLPHELDTKIASIKLAAMGYQIDTLTEAQRKYLGLD